MGKVAQPEEIARWVWLLTGSGDAGFMTGETITLSGGDVIRWPPTRADTSGPGRTPGLTWNCFRGQAAKMTKNFLIRSWISHVPCHPIGKIAAVPASRVIGSAPSSVTTMRPSRT